LLIRFYTLKIEIVKGGKTMKKFLMIVGLVFITFLGIGIYML